MEMPARTMSSAASGRRWMAAELAQWRRTPAGSGLVSARKRRSCSWVKAMYWPSASAKWVYAPVSVTCGQRPRAASTA